MGIFDFLFNRKKIRERKLQEQIEKHRLQDQIVLCEKSQNNELICRKKMFMPVEMNVGDKLYHKHLGKIKIVSILDSSIQADTGSRGILAFNYYDFGKVLFIDEYHLGQSFKTPEEYMIYCESIRSMKIEQMAESTQESQQRELLEEAHYKENDILANRRRIDKNKKLYESEKQNLIQKKKQEMFDSSAKLEKEFKHKLITFLKENFQYKGFHHYTDISNFLEIMKMGKLLSRHRASELGFTDAADQNVLTHTNRYIMDYVRFYYKEKTPTFYRNEGIKVNNAHPHMPIPVVLLFDENIIHDSNVAFLSGGGGNPNSIFTKDIHEANKFDWNVIFYRGPIPRQENNLIGFGNDTSGASITNKKNAEFLYPREIDIKYVKKIIFRSRADLKHATTVLGENSLFEVDNNRLKFNYIHNFLYDYEIKLQDRGLLFIALKFERQSDSYKHELKVMYSDNTMEVLNIKNTNVRKIDIEKSLKYIDYGYLFYFRLLSNKTVIQVKYLMNGHVSAIWEGN